MSFNTAKLITSTYGSKGYTAGLDEIVISMDIDWSDGNTVAFITFQGMFAIITPALISGAIIERFKFS